MILDKSKISEYLGELLNKSDLSMIKQDILSLKENLSSFEKDREGFLNIGLNGHTIKISDKYLDQELKQILDTNTIERTKYYISRLVKAVSKIKTSKINDINLNQWKDYDDILTDSLWILDKRDKSGAHSADYWGNFIPQIPNQLLKRYTKKGDWILDPFLGSGTSLIEAQRLGRNGIGIELQENVLQKANSNIQNDKNLYNESTNIKTILGDSTKVNLQEQLNLVGIKNIQLAILHPPYWDIIKFSDNNEDLSNAQSEEQFLNMFGKVVDNVYTVLENNRFMAVVIGDKYSGGRLVPLGFNCMNEVLKRNFELKSIIVKNFQETKGKMNQKELWRYRALVGGFYIFKHEYIFLFKKK